METRFGGGQGGLFYGHGGGVPDYLSREKEGKRSLEWDLNDWKWDGDLFIATPLNSVPGDCRNRELLPEENRANVLVSNSSSSCSDEIDKGKRELEKRRRVAVYEDGEMNAEARNLTLKLGEHDYPIAESEGGNWDERNGKKSKLVGASSNRAVCQVEDCKADLGNAKDYHRRHKVCEMHSKASKALVGNVMQRFCQQCSRFHLLQEFDEGKRSCRRRLAGHNKRRRKNHPDAVVNGSSLNDDRTSSYLLISLLKILSNMHSNNSDQTKSQDVLSHLLRNLVSNDGAVDGRNVCGLLQESQDLLNAGASAGASSEVLPALPSNGHGSSRNLGSSFEINGDGVATQGTHMRTSDQLVTVAASKCVQNRTNLPSSPDGCQQTLTYSNFTTPFPANPPTQAVVPHSDARRSKINNFDLNSVYSDLQDCAEQLEGSQLPVSLGTRSPEFPPWMRKEPLQSSPPHTSGNSDSASTLSPSSSSGDTQNRTDRIVFKLFGKDPNDFPLVLRGQILDWLSHSPTDIESYIRPGCIVLTIYLRLAESTWQEITGDLSSSLSGLLNLSDESFWRTGWAYTEVQRQIAFIHSGQVVLDIPLPLTSHNLSRIFAVTPIAVSVSERVQFTVKGFNLSQPTTRLLCALEGKYLLEEATHDLLDNDDYSKKHDGLQHLTFPCSVPDVMGRGFIEVEDHGLSSDFFPFIVAEQDVCSEIRMLESVIEVTEFSNDTLGVCSKMEAKNQALDFIHEMGWLIHRSRVRSRVGHIDPMSDVFPFTRYQWLMDFSMDRDWCAVVNKLLDILFEGTVGSGDHSSAELALLELCLVHRAVRRSCRRMVELLLRYVPHKALLPADMESKQQVSGVSDSFFFRPDAIGPAGLTPLHIAASRDGSEDLVDALTDDPGSVGVEAWKNVRDNTGSTPEDYARLRGHYSYIHLIHKKIKKTEKEHVILDIPADLSDYSSKYKNAKSHSAKVSSLQIEKTATRPTQIQHYCKICDQQPIYGTRRSIVYRPAMLSMVAIAAVCVCVALLFKSSPEVLFVYPFRWELLDYGSF